MPRIFWPVFVAMLAAWLAMNLWSVPKIETLSGGLRLLDMRFLGYSYDEAKAFIGAIGKEGTAQYLGAQFWLDMVFPPLLGAVLFLFYRWLFRGWPGVIIGVISLAYVAVDYLENFAIAAMLRAGSEGVTADMVATASQWTTTKWAFSCVGLSMIAIGVVMRLYRR